MKRGSLVFAIGTVVLLIVSSGAVRATDHHAGQDPERSAGEFSAAPSAAHVVAINSDTLIESPQEQQVGFALPDNTLIDEAQPKPISIPSPTAAFAGLALLGILISRRRHDA